MPSWRTALAGLHRYLGIAFCLLFAMWFATGVVMLFRPYPALTEAERFVCLTPFDPRSTLPGFDELAARFPLERATRLRLTSLDGRPVLHIHTTDGITSYWADGRRPALMVQPAEAQAVVSGCGRGPALGTVLVRDDQWTVHQRFDPYRPLYRVRVDDQEGSTFYVSARTGDVVQATTRASRMWGWIGAVPHWIYFTAIRRDWGFWDALVWWVSGVASVGVLAGLVLGIVRWRRSSTSRASPFRGALYWHHVTGLVLGLFVLMWIFSGMLSMDHGRWFSTDAPTDAQVSVLAGIASFGGSPQELARRAGLSGPVRELEWLRVAGRHYVAFRAGPGHQRIVEVDGATAVPFFAASLFADIATRLVLDGPLVDRRVLNVYDADYYGREHAPRPLPVLRLRYDDAAGTWLHVDLASGAILERVDRSRRAYRYWFNALHSHDLPWMLNRPTLRACWMTLLCVAGYGFSVNGAWIAWKRVRRSPAARVTRPSVSLNAD